MDQFGQILRHFPRFDLYADHKTAIKCPNRKFSTYLSVNRYLSEGGGILDKVSHVFYLIEFAFPILFWSFFEGLKMADYKNKNVTPEGGGSEKCQKVSCIIWIGPSNDIK